MKIPCLVLTYFDTEIIQKSVEFLIKEPRLEITLIENPSDTTPINFKYAQNLLKEGKITEYILMDKNISNNAFEMILEYKIKSFKSSPYIIVTDGDLVVEEKDWLDEKIQIMERSPEVFVCGTKLRLDNLPTKVFPNAAQEWFPPVRQDYPLYYDQLTGIWLCLFRTEEFIKYFKYMRYKRHRFIDSHIHVYCYNKIKKNWASTKRCFAWHLTWDRYNDPDHPYSKMKFSKPAEKIWNHGVFAGYSIYSYAKGELIQKKEKIHCLKKSVQAYFHYNYIFNLFEKKTRRLRVKSKKLIKNTLIFTGLWWR